MATRGARCRPRRDNPARTPGRHPLPLLPRAAPQVTLRPLRSRSEETVVTEDPGRATLIDKEECSMSEDSGTPSKSARADALGKVCQSIRPDEYEPQPGKPQFSGLPTLDPGRFG